MRISLGPRAITFYCKINLDNLNSIYLSIYLATPMKDLKMQWSRAFNLVCEVTLSVHLNPRHTFAKLGVCVCGGGGYHN
jgi:hypothetical protein